MSKAETESKVHVKFVTDKEKTKVLFAEAGSDFTGVLLSFLLLPLGTIVKVLKKQYGDEAPNIGSLNTLYNGVASLDSTHFSTEDAKSFLLNPTSLDEDECPQFDRIFTETTASFIISDDLRVMPILECSVISTLSSLGFAMVDMYGTKKCDMDMNNNEILDLLRVSLTSLNPLTAFLLPVSENGISRAAEQGNAINQIGKKAIFMNSKKMILKAIMQKSTKKLLFAQARDDFVSFIFGALTIPLGRVEWYLDSNTGLRTMDNLHRSISDNLYNNHLMTPEAKDMLSKSAFFAKYSRLNEYIPLNFDPTMKQNHVRGSTTYMVNDDLTVSPLSITSSVRAISRMKVSLSDVEELELEVGLEEGLSILKAALTSTTALTDGLIKPILKKRSNQGN